MRRLVLCVLGGLVVGGAAGAIHGHSRGPLVELAAPECGALASGPDVRLDHDELRQLLRDSRHHNLELAARIGSLEELVGSLQSSRVPPSRLARRLIDEMSEDELHDLLTRFASVDRYHLREIEDLRAFASRLAEIALQGTFEPRDESVDAQPDEVLFAAEREVVEPRLVASRSFSGDEEVVHAIFPVGDLDGTQTMLKWTRLDPPRVVAFRRFGVHAEGNAFFAYGIRRPEALEPGRYRVELFRLRDDLALVASGSYDVE